MYPVSFGPKSRKQKLEMMRYQWESERTAMLPYFRDLADYIRPTRIRMNTSDRNMTNRRGGKIYDNTGTVASRILSSGMTSGITNPAVPWFKLSLPDPEMGEWGPAKQWLDTVQKKMALSLVRSNLYSVLPVQYRDMGDFGTAASYFTEDLNGRVVHARSLPIGSYAIGQNWMGQIDSLSRCYQMTVVQMLQQFWTGSHNDTSNWSMFSQKVREEYERGNYNSAVDVVHIVHPNQQWAPEKLLAKYKQFYSCYYEAGVIGGQKYDIKNMDDVYLSESGYDYFPFLVPRWESTGDDTWASDCPGMTALGDIKELQFIRKRIAEALDKKIRPPMRAPTSLRNGGASQLPGDITFTDAPRGATFEAALEVNFDIREMKEDQYDVRQRIDAAYFKDIFLMFGQGDDIQKTATEIEERAQERLLQLGPVYQNISTEQNDAIVNIAFRAHMEQGLLPPPPEDLIGQPLKVEYISLAAQAQKLVGITAHERFTSYLIGLAGVDQRVLHKVRTQELVDEMADILSINPKAMVSDEEFDASVQAAAQAQQSQMMTQNLAQGARAVRDLGETQMGGVDVPQDTALNRVVNNINAQGA